MKHSIHLIVDQNSRSFFTHIPALLNPIQSQFTFVIGAKVNISLHSDAGLDSADAFSDCFRQKAALAMLNEDLLVMFTQESLMAEGGRLKNLFIAGSSLNESPPRVAVISTRFIQSGIIKPDLHYLGQRHALYHLLLCVMLGSFLDLGPHKDNGCILDFNNYTPGIQQKIDTGYSFCSQCNHNVQVHKYGASISAICAELKSRGHLDVAGVAHQAAMDFSALKLSTANSRDEAFESLCAQLYARADGASTVEHLEPPDRGVDILVTRDGRAFAVQCKYFVDAFGSAQLA